MSSILAGFVKGASGQALDRLEKREDAELEMKKAAMLEQLRKETAKELAEFEENLPSAKLSRAQTEQNMRLADEDQEMDRGKYAMDKESFELGKIDREREWAMKEEDQSMRRARFQLDSAATHEHIRASRAQRAAQRRLDEESARSDNILFKEYERTIDELISAGANPSVVANFQTAWNEGVNMKNWNRNQQRTFLHRTRETFTRGWTDKGGKRQAPLLQTYGSARDAQLEERLKD